METEKELNEKILKITMTIKNQYPELSKYIEEMPITVPDENNLETTLFKLRQYLKSLESLLKKYIKEKIT